MVIRISFKIIILFIVGLMFESCNSNSTKLFDDAAHYYMNYIITNDTFSLNKSYTIISEKMPMHLKNLAQQDFHLIANVYLLRKKNIEFQELCDKLLESNLDQKMEYLVKLKSNLNKYYIDKNKEYIEESYALVNKRIGKEKNNNILYVDYFTIMLHDIKNKNYVLAKIDTFQLINQKFTEEFYEYQLKEYISEYPETFYKETPKEK